MNAIGLLCTVVRQPKRKRRKTRQWRSHRLYQTRDAPQPSLQALLLTLAYTLGNIMKTIWSSSKEFTYLWLRKRKINLFAGMFVIATVCNTFYTLETTALRIFRYDFGNVCNVKMTRIMLEVAKSDKNISKSRRHLSYHAKNQKFRRRWMLLRRRYL